MDKVLNFPDALTLASLLSKYVDIKLFNPEQVVLDFLSEILDKIEPSDYLRIIKLLSGEPTAKIERLGGDELLKLLFSGLEKNRILSLLDAYKNIGFT